MRLYVGNIPWTTTDADLSELMSQYGPVSEAKVITDRDSGKSKGFGFVEMSAGGDEAINNLNDTEYCGRRIVVNVAKEKPRTGGQSRDRSRDNGRNRRDEY